MQTPVFSARSITWPKNSNRTPLSLWACLRAVRVEAKSAMRVATISYVATHIILLCAYHTTAAVQWVLVFACPPQKSKKIGLLFSSVLLCFACVAPLATRLWWVGAMRARVALIGLVATVALLVFLALRSQVQCASQESCAFLCLDSHVP